MNGVDWISIHPNEAGIKIMDGMGMNRKSFFFQYYSFNDFVVDVGVFFLFIPFHCLYSIIARCLQFSRNSFPYRFYQLYKKRWFVCPKKKPIEWVKERKREYKLESQNFIFNLKNYNLKWFFFRWCGFLL